MLLPLYGEDISQAKEEMQLTEKESAALLSGEALSKRMPRDTIEKWVIENKERREKREDVLRRLEKVLKALHKLFLREKRSQKYTTEFVKSDIIAYMDGSTLLWLSVIASAKKEFLKLHDDPRRIESWDSASPMDLCSPNGEVKRGFEDAWAYLTARDFLLDDSYEIDIDCPKEVDEKLVSTKSVNLETLLEYLIENCKNREIEAGIIDPSVNHLRRSLAKASGDPYLIAKYCKDK